MVTAQVYHDIAAYRTLPLNGYEKVAIINAILIPTWTYRGLILGNTSRMAMWDDILLQYVGDTPRIEQQLSNHRLRTDLSHGGSSLCPLVHCRNSVFRHRPRLVKGSQSPPAGGPAHSTRAVAHGP